MNAHSFIGRTLVVAITALSLACGGERSIDAGGGAVSGSGKPLTIKGSDTMVILGQRLAEQYMKEHAGSVIQVNGGGSGTGIAALINGTVDLAQSSRSMKDDEKAKAKKSRGADILETPVALDSIAVFVNRTNPVKALSIEQIASIFGGRTKNWSEIGGPDAPIVLYGRESSSGTYDYFREHVLNKGDFSPAVQTLQGTAAVINAVSRDANGIGYGGIAYAKDVRAVGIAAAGGVIEPTAATVADGSYPLSRKLFFYYPANAPERVKTFVDWTLTPTAQALVVEVGYFPLRQAGEETGAPAATDSRKP